MAARTGSSPTTRSACCGWPSSCSTETDRTDELRALGLPVLVAFGDRDDVWPPSLQASTAERLGARVAAWPGVGHSPAADAPDTTVADLLAFWASTESPS